MSFKDGTKSGGRKPGSKNKLTLAKAKIREQAMAKIGSEHPDAFKGDPLGFLLAIMRSPDFDPEMRMEAATRAAQYVHAKKTESTIDDKRVYVSRMPLELPGNTPAEKLAEWMKLYGEVDKQTESEDTLKTLASMAAVKKEGLQ